MARPVGGSLILCLLAVPLAHSQTTVTVATKDPTAISVIQRSLSAMGCSQALAFHDSLGTGQATIYQQDGTTQSLPIVKKTIGTTLTRTELQRPEGTNIRIVNNGDAALVRPDGSTKRLIRNNVIAERVEHIPCLSLLTEFQAPSITVDYLGTDSVDGRPVDVVALSIVSDGDPNLKAMTSTRFSISRDSGMVLGIQYRDFAENNTNLFETEQVFFSDYRVVNGVLTPFQEADFSDGNLRAVIAFSSIAFNAGISASDFTLPSESEN